MALNTTIPPVGYGLSQALLNLPGLPIVAVRNPTTADKAQIGTQWINTTTNGLYFLTSIVANVSTWTNAAGEGGGGDFDALTVTGITTLTGALTQTGGAANIGTDATANAVNIGTAGARTVTVGSATGAATTVVQSGTGGISLSAAGAVSMAPSIATIASPTAAATVNKRVGVVTFTGFTTDNAAAQIFTITNSTVLATSGIFVSAANKGTNDAEMAITQVKPAAGSFAVTLTNEGSAALNGDVIITFWVIS